MNPQSKEEFCGRGLSTLLMEPFGPGRVNIYLFILRRNQDGISEPV
jgi:hypothetical protein